MTHFFYKGTSGLVKIAQAFAPGIPDKNVYGDVLNTLKPGDITDFVLQRHDTVRNPKNPHYDMRLGTKDTNLFSWAVPGAVMPEPGQIKRPLPQTQLHCLPGSTGLLTERGVITIADIVRKRLRVNVWSYDTKTGAISLKPVTDWWHRPCDEPVLRIRTDNTGVCAGATVLACTKGHKLPTPDGMRYAGDLKVGDILLSYNVTLSPQQWQIAYGTLLGDGFIDATHETLSFSHCSTQRDYAQYKADSLNPVVTGLRLYSSTGFGVKRDVWRTVGPAHRPEVAALYPNVYDAAGIKRVSYLLDRLDAQGLAVWYQDDGSCIHTAKGRLRGASLATHGFLPDDVDYIVNWFAAKWGITARKIDRGTTKRGHRAYELRFNVAEARKLFALITPFIHPTMAYKVSDSVDACRSHCRVCGAVFGAPVYGKRGRPQQICSPCLLRPLASGEFASERAYDKAYRNGAVSYSPRTYRLRFSTFDHALKLARTPPQQVETEAGQCSRPAHERLPVLAPVMAVIPLRVRDVRPYSGKSLVKFADGLYNITVKDNHTYITAARIIVGNSHQYGAFEGVIPYGYGKGTVSMADKGKAIITRVTPNTMHFTLGHAKVPTRYVLIHVGGKDGRMWQLYARPTPGKIPGVGDKPVFRQIQAQDQEDAIAQAQELQEKIDGAHGIVNIGPKGEVDVYSVRPSVKGTAIPHTERMGLFGVRVPPKFKGQSFRGEMYFTDLKGRAVPFKDVSGLLNMLPAKSLETQRERKLSPRIALFDTVEGGERDARQQQVDAILSVLPQELFHRPAGAKTLSEKRKLFRTIAKGKNPRTAEGVMAVMPDGSVRKIKNKEEITGYLTGTYPGAGKRKGTAGGLTFVTDREQKGAPEGRVGTGFTDRELQDIVARIEELKGSPMRLEHMGRFGTGKLRAPSFKGFETDKPGTEKQAIMTHKHGQAKPQLVRRLIFAGDKEALRRMGRASTPAKRLAAQVRSYYKTLPKQLVTDHLNHPDMQHVLSWEGAIGKNAGAGEWLEVSGRDAFLSPRHPFMALPRKTAAAVIDNIRRISSGPSVTKQGQARVRLRFKGKDGIVKASALVAVADTPATRRRGLGGHAPLADGQGMFFDKAGTYWMKDVDFPLDILFLADDGRILEKQCMAVEPDPQAPATYYTAPATAAHALELPAGWCDRVGVGVGDQITG